MRKSVVGWEGFYEVEPDGSVYSLPRTVTRSDGSIQTWRGMMLKSFLNSAGYLVVRLSRIGKRQIARVHRLVADAFLANPDGLPEVNHIDGVKTNAAASNLEWCTSSQNRHHAYHVLGVIVMPRRAKLSFEAASAIRAEHVPGVFGCKRLAKKYGVDPKTILAILHNRTYALPPPPEVK